jgi:O-antigen ligase
MKFFLIQKEKSIFYYSALLFALTLPLSRGAVSFFLIWFILLFLIGKNYRTAWEQIKTTRAFVAMGAFIAFMFASLLWSNDTAILAVSLKKEWLPNIITAFLGGMFISEIIAYGIYFEWWSYKNSTPDYPSPFMFHIHYSIFLATTAIVLLSRLLSKRYTWRSKLPMAIFFLTSIGNLMISNGRTGQLALLVAMIVAIIIHYRLTIKSFFLFLILSIPLFVGAYTTIDLFQKRADMAMSDIQQFQQGNFNTSWGLRAAFWIVTYDIFQEHPLLGVGAGDYRSAAAEALRTHDHGFSQETIAWCSDTHFHNQYLMVLAQIGVIGFALMMWMLVELFRLKIGESELKEFSILGLSVFSVSCIAEPLWILQFPIILFVFIVGLSLSASKPST